MNDIFNENVSLKTETPAFAKHVLGDVICWWYGGVTSAVACKIAIDIYGIEVSSGNVPTTISAQLLFANGTAVSIAAQTITSGTDLTDLRSGFYKFSLPAYSVTRNVTFNFLIAD